MRTFSTTTLIAAPPERVWSVLVDVTRWPEWLPTVTEIESLDAHDLTMGGRYRLTQPKLRPAIWSVVSLDPQRAFSWESRSTGVRALASHVLEAAPGNSTRVTLQIEFTGPLSALVGWLAGRLTSEYLLREAASLKQCVEATHS